MEQSSACQGGGGQSVEGGGNLGSNPRVGSSTCPVTIRGLRGKLPASSECTFDARRTLRHSAWTRRAPSKRSTCEVVYVLSFTAGKEFEATTDGTKNTDVHLYVYDEASKEVGKDDSPGPKCSVKVTPAN